MPRNAQVGNIQQCLAGRLFRHALVKEFLYPSGLNPTVSLLSRCEASVLQGEIERFDADLRREFTQTLAVSGLPSRTLALVPTHISHLSRLESPAQTPTILFPPHTPTEPRP